MAPYRSNTPLLRQAKRRVNPLRAASSKYKRLGSALENEPQVPQASSSGTTTSDHWASQTPPNSLPKMMTLPARPTGLKIRIPPLKKRTSSSDTTTSNQWVPPTPPNSPHEKLYIRIPPLHQRIDKSMHEMVPDHQATSHSPRN